MPAFVVMGRRNDSFCTINRHKETLSPAPFVGEVSLGGKVLYKRKLQDIMEDIRISCRLYPEFAGAEPLVSSLYRAADSRVKGPSQPGSINLSADEIQKKFAAGSPLIENPVVDKKAFRELFGAISEQFVKREPSLEDALKEAEAFLREYFSEGEEGGWQVRDMPVLISQMVEKTPVKSDLATLMVTFALSSLFAHSYNLDDAENIDAVAWEQGNCPVCGVKPHYGLLKDKEGVRMLGCWLCDFRWVFPRLKCSYCLNEDQKDLGFFTVGASESCRVHFCKKCSNYVKIFDLRNAIAEDTHLPVRNLATLSYDLCALKEGFKPGSGLQWVSEEEQNQSAN